MAIYVNIKRQRTVKEFLVLLYSFENDNYLTCVETYHDKEYLNLQCKKGKYRSIYEILEIVNTYYSSITIKKLSKILHNLIITKNNKNYYFYSLYCSKIKRTTSMFTPFKCNFMVKSKGNSLYSGKEFYDLSKT